MTYCDIDNTYIIEVIEIIVNLLYIIMIHLEKAFNQL